MWRSDDLSFFFNVILLDCVVHGSTVVLRPHFFVSYILPGWTTIEEIFVDAKVCANTAASDLHAKKKSDDDIGCGVIAANSHQIQVRELFHQIKTCLLVIF
jgi:hypothetical protein